MSHGESIPLTPFPIGIRSDEFQGILDWPFGDAYVGRLLQNDIPKFKSSRESTSILTVTIR